MLKEIIQDKPKIHTRTISLATYPYKESEIIVEGTLLDKRNKKTFDIMGNVREPGLIHHMVIRLLIKGNPLRISHAETEMLHVPMDECKNTAAVLQKTVGFEVKSGFSNIIRKTMGGKNGCTHLAHLLTVMGQEIVHGWFTHKRSSKASVPTSMDRFLGSQYILNSCKMWAEDGPRWKELKEKLTQKP